jgi:hypothetical protein
MTGREMSSETQHLAGVFALRGDDEYQPWRFFGTVGSSSFAFVQHEDFWLRG